MRSIFFIMFTGLCFSLSAQEQKGFVRTAGTAQSEVEMLENVIIRPQGGNSALSDKSGSFILSFDQAGIKEGDGFMLTMVYKKGHEPLDKNFLSRKHVYSSKVPIEIVMISTEQLLEAKQAVESSAMKNAQMRYDVQVHELKRELEDQAISIETYQERLRSLELQMVRFEQLLPSLSEHYARTDYGRLDSLNILINTCIMNGELEKADSLINSKGDIKIRAAQNMQKGHMLNHARILLDSLDNEIGVH